jgi:hypothetical protein
MGTDGGCVYTGGCAQIAKGMSQAADNVSVSVSVKAQATATDIGVQVKATADRQTLDDGSITVSARTATGGVALQAQATVDLTVGPTSVGENGTTVSVRSGLVGAQVSAGDKGANVQVSVRLPMASGLDVHTGRARAPIQWASIFSQVECIRRPTTCNAS